MKRCVLTTNGDILTLDHMCCGDPMASPIHVNCTTTQFRKELKLWLELFDHIWPIYQSNQVIGKLVN